MGLTRSIFISLEKFEGFTNLLPGKTNQKKGLYFSVNQFDVCQANCEGREKGNTFTGLRNFSMAIGRDSFPLLLAFE